MKIKVFEVGPRDGLQNEKHVLSLDDKVHFCKMLVDAGHSFIEVGAFVNPEKVPQMADSHQVFQQVAAAAGAKNSLHLSALVPNMKGYEAARAAGAKEIAVFTAASESFNKANINATIKESIGRFKPVVEQARKDKVFIRGYVSTAFGCPYEGTVAPRKVYEVTEMLLDLKVQEISIGDTIGVADPAQVKIMSKALLKLIAPRKLALHFHDTRGTALANILAALETGVTAFDSSTGGLGGCPYAPGAAGNVATEDLIYMLHRIGLKTGINLEKLIAASEFIQSKLGHTLPSRYLQAALATKASGRKNLFPA